MRSFIIGLVAGVALLQMRATLPSQLHMVILGATAVLVGLSCRIIRFQSIKVIFKLCSGVLFGFAWAAWIASLYLATELPEELEGKDITVVGTVSSLPNRFEQGVRFNFTVEEVKESEVNAEAAPKQSVPSLLALSWYSNFAEEENQAIGEIKPGQRWQLTVRLKRPHGNANPYGFDYEAWLLEQNIRATGYVRPDRNTVYKNARLGDFAFSLRNAVELYRYKLREKIMAALPDKEYAGVIVALVIGDQRGISQSDWQVFNKTGIGHLVSISGLHITMVAGLFASLVFFLWCKSFFTQAKLPLVLPAQKAAALAGAFAALLYVALAGFGVPAQRTLYMLWVVALALWLGRLTSLSYVLCIALGVVVLLDPWAVLWPGFWLSFSAVGVILYASVGRASQYSFGAGSSGKLAALRSIVSSATYLQLAITLGMVPLTLLLFGQVSVVSPVANAIAIPVISFIVTPLALVGSFAPVPVSNGLFKLSYLPVEWLARFLDYLAHFKFATWTVPIPSWWMFIAALIGTAWMLAPRGWPMRWIGICMWVPLVLNADSRPSQGEMWVTAFDVGQGGAVLIETERHRILYDTGPYYSPESDGGSRVIVPYLKARGISFLDAVMVSHNDNDHSGGALSILKDIRVGWVSSSLELDSPIVQASANHIRCQSGQAWSWDGVRFEMLFPDEGVYENVRRKPNAGSCTLKATIGGQSILLPGDIEARQERELMEASMEKLPATILLAPHHGSGTSSTEAFLQMVEPEIALFQVGYRNRFRHPKDEIYERYGQLGVRRYRSDESGAVMLKLSSGTDLKVTGYREEHKRYWYGQ